ncbi:MAG: YbhB/YbcL family Raf kinase inhibitor-like protein [Pseudomonadota bacterium]
MLKFITPLFVAVSISAPAVAFDFSFDWSGLKLCTSGNPNTVKNPTFKLENVPEGTKFIRFKLVDLDVPQYNHGGGVVAYDGSATIAPGAFRYKSPCPPNGAHTYEWRATAQKKKNGGKLATATAQRQYP